MWNAEWIWGTGEPSPRNEWRCFRQTFNPGKDDMREAALKLTADSRYVLCINDELVGRGPVRSWPDELSYDTYPVGHLLKADSDNVIAVLVSHYGVSNFQYLRGRGGLILQIDTPERDVSLLATDGSWKTAVHPGYDTQAARMSCQLAFTERYDARALTPDWQTASFDDEGWEYAVTIGKEDQPWKTLVPRTIPFMTEEPLYPARIHSVRRIKPIDWSASLDLRQLFAPEAAEHANPVSLLGLLATEIELEQPGQLTIGTVDPGRLAFRLSVNGAWLTDDAYFGNRYERYAHLQLGVGRHFLLIDVSGTTHGHSYHLGIAGQVPFRLRHPLEDAETGGATVPFAAIGPFETAEHIDHQPARRISGHHSDYTRALQIDSTGSLLREAAWLRQFPDNLWNPEDVFGLSVWQKSCDELSVPSQLQHAVTSGSDYALIPATRDGHSLQIIVDFGQELSGYHFLELEAAAGTIIDAYGFEYMQGDDIQHTYELDNTLRYICMDGRQSYLSPVRRGFRYVMLTISGAASPVKLHKLQLRQSNYPAAHIGHFHSNDALLNDIWSISRHTIKLCMEDTFVDCPAYEQVFWVGDARNEALVSYYSFDSNALVERCLRLVPGSRGQTPFYADQVPSGWNSVIPNWTFFWVTACLEYYRYTGDRQFAVSIWPHVEYTLSHFMTKINEQGLLSFKGWNLLDWAGFEQPGDGVVAPQNMFMAKALEDSALLAEAAGDPEGSADMIQSSLKLKAAIRNQLWDSERQAYLDCIHTDGRPSATTSMQTQIVALLCGIAEGERKDLLVHYLEHPPASFVQIGSPFMSFFYHEALALVGRYDLLVQDIREQYAIMIEKEASTCWEMYPSSNYVSGTDMPTRSHCHAWSAGPVYFLGRYVLGVSGKTPGWKEVAVQPQLCGLSSAKGSVPLAGGGRIDVEWEADHSTKQFKLTLKAPEAVKLTVETPEGYTEQVQIIRLEEWAD